MTDAAEHSFRQWTVSLPQYIGLTNDFESDSEYLRRVGLKPQIRQLCAMSTGPVLDIGAADGWLRRELQRSDILECDITVPPHVVGVGRPFVVGRVEALPFKTAAFSTVVASLVLMWLDDLALTYRELRRVCTEGGQLVVALVHPSFYRVGQAHADGSFTIDRSLADRWSIDDHRIAGRGGQLTYFHHRFDDYIMTAHRNGWQLETVRDWFIDLDDYGRHVRTDEQHIVRSGHIPLYCFLRFTAIAS